MASAAETPRIGTEKIQNVGFGFKHAAVLMAAIELSLFTRVSEGAATLESIASACGMSPLNAERLVVACHALGLLEKDGDQYRNAPDVEMYLVEGKPRYFGAWSIMGKADWADWVNLGDKLVEFVHNVLTRVTGHKP